MGIYIDIYDLKEWDIWFAGIPYAAPVKTAKSLKQWTIDEDADIAYNLALFNMTGIGSDQYGVIKGRTLQYLRAKGVDCGYGGTEQKLTIDANNVASGAKVAILNNEIKNASSARKRSRNMHGLLFDGRYIHVQTDNGYTEREVAAYVLARYKVSILLIQDAGGSTGKYTASTLFSPEREGANGRPVCSVVCVKKKGLVNEPVHTQKKVFIGVGHGGADPGATSNGLVEKDINLIMALSMREELERHGVKVGISRTKDENDRLTDELKECNAFGPDLAVEIHNNSGGGDGFEIFIYPGSTKGKQLATYIETEVKNIGQSSRGIKTSTALGWVRQVSAPAVLCEGFFLDSSDCTIGDSVAKQRKFGTAYAKGVLKMLGIPYVPIEKEPSNRDIVQERFGFDDATMKYLDGHPYKDSLYEKLAIK